MAYYLSMDGVDDYIRIPAVTFDDFVMDFSAELPAGVEKQFLQGNLVDSRFRRLTSGTDRYDATWKQSYVNDVLKAWNTVIVPHDTRITLKLVPNALNNAYTFVNVFTNNNLSMGYTKGKIYSIKLYLGATLVAHYDMTTQTVQDQSGNGRHATLTGGTWVNEGGGGTTHTGDSSVTGVSTVTASATVSTGHMGQTSVIGVASVVASGSVLGPAQTGNAAVVGVSSVVATGSVNLSGNVAVVGVSTVIASAAGMSIKGDASVFGVSGVTASGIVKEPIAIISTVKLLGAFEHIIKLSGERDYTVKLSGEREATVKLMGGLNATTLRGGL